MDQYFLQPASRTDEGPILMIVRSNNSSPLTAGKKVPTVPVSRDASSTVSTSGAVRSVSFAIVMHLLSHTMHPGD